jgi:hypothetical protein
MPYLAKALPIDFRIVRHHYEYPIDVGSENIYRGMVVEIELSPHSRLEEPSGDDLVSRLVQDAVDIATHEGVDVSSVRILNAIPALDRELRVREPGLAPG